MTEILNGIGYGNIFIDEDHVSFTSSQVFCNFETCLTNVLELMIEDLSKILNIPAQKIISDYLSESRCNIMEESFYAGLQKQYEKEGMTFQKSETSTRRAINHILNQ